MHKYIYIYIYTKIHNCWNDMLWTYNYFIAYSKFSRNHSHKSIKVRRRKKMPINVLAREWASWLPSLFTCLKLYLWKISYNIQISSITWPNHGFWWRLVVDSCDNSLTISFELYLRNAKFSSKTYCPTNCQGYFIFTQLTLKKQLCIYTKSFNSTKARYHASLYQISFASSTYVRLPIF